MYLCLCSLKRVHPLWPWPPISMLSQQQHSISLLFFFCLVGDTVGVAAVVLGNHPLAQCNKKQLSSYYLPYFTAARA